MPRPDQLRDRVQHADLFTAEPAGMLGELFQGVMQAAGQAAAIEIADPRAAPKLEELAEQLDGCRQMALRARQRLMGAGG